ncbi:hypothetical protein CLV32_4581 [Pedobacter duraquae]|uniref:Uncharacterized protein n=1 Tax=Pedobacter duraquae TaxID=425511 RepID=A0A4R6ICK5_9SPHI|nr:hypothetical protein CLV32_4581 [Pedobacter duraquae]
MSLKLELYFMCSFSLSAHPLYKKTFYLLNVRFDHRFNFDMVKLSRVNNFT